MADFRKTPDTAFLSHAAGLTLYGPALTFERVATDSRDCGADSLFVCLRGERVDGHDYVQQARAAGCRCFLVAASWYDLHASDFPTETDSVLVAADTLTALQAGARAWRLYCQQAASQLGHNLLKIGITGSSGKTTVKELVASILLAWRPGVKNPGNLNSDIGLAASLFLLRPHHQVAVFEMGINYPGEMSSLAALYEPDYALITNIGTAHIGVLGGTRQGIASEKKKISSQFNGSQTLFLNEEEEFRSFLVAGIKGKVAFFGPRAVSGFTGANSLGVAGWQLDYNGRQIRFALPGAHNLLNALAAIALAAACGVADEIICRGLEGVRAMSGRSQLLELAGLTIVNDSYNANSDSMLKAIEMCNDVGSGQRLVLVLGSMKELGAYAVEAHRTVGAAAAQSRAVCVAFYGEEMRDAWKAALETEKQLLDDSRMSLGDRKSYIYTCDFDELAQLVLAEVKRGDLVLIKGSRSMALERLTSRLAQREGGDVS